MFDRTGAFTGQFTPAESGYVYYPSRRSGGKFVTADEYEALAADWKRRTVPWKAAGLIGIAILVWTIFSKAVDLPGWTDGIIITLSVAILTGWSFWASYAPRRLVKDRPDVVPPRSLSEARRVARTTLNWPVVLFFLLASGAVFIAKLSSPERTVGWWGWVLGSGLMFGAYIWIAFEKARDRQRPPQSSNS